MVHCDAHGCNHESTEKFAPLKLSWHKIPEGQLGKAWKAKINRTSYSLEPHLCSAHFTPADYKRDLQHELLGLDLRKILKPDAVQSIFSHTQKQPLKRRVASEERAAKKQQQMMIQQTMPCPPLASMGTRRLQLKVSSAQKKIQLPASTAQFRPAIPSIPQFRPNSTSTALFRPVIPSAAQFRMVSPSTAQLRPAMPSTAQLRPAIPSTAQLRPAMPSTARLRPAMPSTAQLRPTMPSTAQLRPAMPSTAQLRPAIPSTAQLRPAMPSTAQLRPAIPSTAQLRPAIPSTAQLRPTMPSTAQLRPAIPSTAQLRPAMPSTARFRPDSLSTAQLRLDSPSTAQLRLDSSSTAQLRLDSSSTAQLRPDNPSSAQCKPVSPSSVSTCCKTCGQYSYGSTVTQGPLTLKTDRERSPEVIPQSPSSESSVDMLTDVESSIDELKDSEYHSEGSLLESLEEEEDDPNDPNYTPSGSQSLDDDSVCSEETPAWTNVIDQKKVIVFEQCLDQLFRMCQKCGKLVVSKTTTFRGAQMIVKTECLGHCNFTWRSSPVVKKMGAVNFLLPAAVLFSGGSYSKIAQLAKHMNLEILSKQQFHIVQKTLLFPVIWDTWKEEEKRVLDILREQESVILAGDGRSDSPGFSAKYGTYTLMDTSTDLVVGFEVVQVTDVTSSQAMEKEGLIRALDHLQEEGVEVNTLATDRHPGITATLRDKYPNIKHQYDVWHFAKSVRSALIKVAKRQGCGDLFPWIPSIINHLWWSASSCGGDAVLLKQMYLSIIHHISNKHEWGGCADDQITTCAHGPIPGDAERKTKWLICGSPAHEALKDVLLKKRFLKDLPGLKDFRHTGQLEVFHSLLLKYCPKRQHFSAAGMNARHALAVIDNNHNIGRCQAVTKDGQPRGNVVFPKAKKEWVYKPIKEKKSYDFVNMMTVKVLLRKLAGETDTLQDRLPHRPKNIAPANKVKPSKAEMLESYQSRFAKSEFSKDSSTDESFDED